MTDQPAQPNPRDLSAHPALATPWTPEECRVLGVLVEKAQTVPAQYPMTLNSLVTGSNQRNNREPVVDYDESRVQRALDSLRRRGLALEVHLAGSRVPKFRHVAREALAVGTSELVILAELLLRGPQTPGELRQRASRMHPLDSLEAVTALLQSLAEATPPLVRKLPPTPGERAERWVQLLCPTLHPLDFTPSRSAEPSSPSSTGGRSLDPVHEALEALTRRVDRLERELAELREARP